jgi:predicted PurR-regulated permease PerM
VVVIGLLVYAISWILLPFVIAGVLAYVCTPLVDALALRLRLPRTVLAVAVFLVLVGLAALLGMLVGPPVLAELTTFGSDLRGTIEAFLKGAIGTRTIELLGRPMRAEDLAEAAVNAVSSWMAEPSHLGLLVGSSIGAVFAFFLTIVLLFYFLLNGAQLVRGAFWLVPPRQRPLIEQVWARLDPILKRYFIGVLIVLVYASCAAYVGLGLVLGIPHAVLLALMTGLLEMIPVVGPIAAAIAAGLVAVRYSTGVQAIVGYALYATALRLSIDQLIGPIALGTAARLHPAVIIFCFLSGGLLFGISGIIMAVPVALALRTTLAVLYERRHSTHAVGLERLKPR